MLFVAARSLFAQYRGISRKMSLLAAVVCNDQEAVEELLAFRADANWAAEGQDPLCVAVRRRMRGITRALLMHGADVDARSAGRPSPDLFFSCNPEMLVPQDVNSPRIIHHSFDQHECGRLRRIRGGCLLTRELYSG